MEKIKTKQTMTEMEIEAHNAGPFIFWREVTGWKAVYALEEGETLVATQPIIGWAVIGAYQPGNRHYAAEIRGVISKNGPELILPERSGNFLGYLQNNRDAHDRFWKDALAYRERKSLENRKRVK